MPTNQTSDSHICQQLQQWVEQIIIRHNFCPFAKREFVKGSIRYTVDHAQDIETCLHKLIDECIYLDEHEDTETTLIIFPDAVPVFDDFLDLVEMAEILLVEQGYEGTYQIANFHPDYIFADSTEDDPANYTNRTPWPVLHLLRSERMAKVLEGYPQPEKIPENNIKLARKLGLETMQKELRACKEIKSEK